MATLRMLSAVRVSIAYQSWLYRTKSFAYLTTEVHGRCLSASFSPCHEACVTSALVFSK
jgi:hypothetical protein